MEINKRNSKLYKVNVQQKKEEAFNHLAQVVDILDSFEIDYWIEYGTLLGAVREKNVIPWDSEFDIGIWNDDYVKIKAELIRKFSDYGFHINLSAKDRIKLLHKDIYIGAYSIDLHTYHRKKDIAYVSFNKTKQSFMNSFLKKIHKTFLLLEKDSRPTYMMGDMIKLIMSYQDIPEEFLFKPGRFNFGRSFTLILNDFVINNDDIYMQKIGFRGRMGIKIAKLMPYKLHRIIYNYLSKKVEELELTNDAQVIPAHFFKNLTKIKFGNLMISCPKDYQEYVRLVYGEEWYVRKSTWKRSQNEINRTLN